MKPFFRTKKLALGAIIAALYAALTYFSAAFGLAIGPFQFRLSEALVVLPMLTPAAVPGLFCGCLVANLLSGAHVMDVVFGSVASLLGALGTYAFRKKPLLALLSPIVANGVIIPPVIWFVYGFQGSFAWLLVLFFVEETVTAGGLGWLLYRALKTKEKLFQ